MARHSFVNARSTTMTMFYLTIPLTAVAVATAVAPVLVGSYRHHRTLREGQTECLESAAQESDFWHHILGHRQVEGYAPTPDLVSDAEVARVVSGDRVVATQPTVWALQPQE